MKNASASPEINLSEIFETLTLNMAVTVCDQLESAGLPARLAKVANGFGIFLPKQFASQGRELLNGIQNNVEILC